VDVHTSESDKGARPSDRPIVYAVLTGQLGFIPGCTVSATVQLRSFLCQSVDARARRAV